MKTVALKNLCGWCARPMPCGCNRRPSTRTQPRRDPALVANALTVKDAQEASREAGRRTLLLHDRGILRAMAQNALTYSAHMQHDHAARVHRRLMKKHQDFAQTAADAGNQAAAKLHQEAAHHHNLAQAQHELAARSQPRMEPDILSGTANTETDHAS